MSRLSATIRARLTARVRALLERRGAEHRAQAAAVGHLRADLADLGRRIGALESHLGRLRADADLGSRPFESSMTIDQAWRRHPGARGVFAAFHLPACDTCAVRFDERLDEAAEAHGLDGDALLHALNDLLAEN